MRLTRQTVAALKLQAGNPYKIIWDDALPGFGVRVNPTGKVWVVQYRTAGKSRRETIGRVDAIALDAARERAKRTLARVQLGADPHAERLEAEAQRSVTFGKVAERYLRNAEGRLKPRSFEEVRRHLQKHWAGLHRTPLHRIDRSSIAERLEEIARQSGPIASNRARAAASAMFAYALGMGLADKNPVVGTLKLGQEVHRDHVLNEDELRIVWNSAGDSDYARIVRLLIVTGQRRDEVGSMHWSEFNLDAALWTIPSHRTKNGRAHEVHLSPSALKILNDIPRVLNRELVFGGGAKGFSSWSKSKSDLDKRIAGSKRTVRPWRLHDLRRTVATGMANLGVQPHVIEAVLNHVSGTKSGVAGIYNRASYQEEKKHALDVWSKSIDRLRRLGH